MLDTVKRIFIVEDDPLIVRMVAAAIEREGWVLASANRCEGALEALRGFNPDIAVLDVQLPDGRGFELCASIRADVHLASLPVCFLTAQGSVHDRLIGFQSGAQDYVAKPFSPAELVARLRAHLAVAERVEETERINRQLAAEARLRQDVTDMAVHDLRAPVGAMKITLDLLSGSGLLAGSPYAKAVQNSEVATEFMLFLINDLLDISRGVVEPKPEPVDIATLASRLMKMLGPAFGIRNIRLRLELPGGRALVKTDGGLLFRILANLLANARKFSPDGSDVTLRFSIPPGLFQIEVVDQGPGIPDAEKEIVFLKFHRIEDQVSRAETGNGIGLAFCKLAAESLGGKIRVEDAPGGGCRMVLQIPDAQ